MSKELDPMAREVAAQAALGAIEGFKSGSMSRMEALRAVIAALRVEEEKSSEAKPGDSSSAEAGGEDGERGGSSDDKGGKPSKLGGKKNKGKQGEQGKGAEDSEADSGDGDSESEDGDAESGQDGQGEASQSAGEDAGDGSESRGAGAGDIGSPAPVDSAVDPKFDDPRLDALLAMLERIVAERTKEVGRGRPRFRTWSPGDQISSGEEIRRYEEDEVFDIDPLERRCVRRRDHERHLLAVFIDSSGSVSNQLFGQLYCVLAELADKVASLPMIFFGVGQFSGGATWVMEPTNDLVLISAFAEEKPVRLYSGGTTVGEIYGLLPEWFAGYRTADLVVLTDGYVENGKELATSLQAAHNATSCEIKLHGVVFEGLGSLKQFRRAKDECPEYIRTWSLSKD